MNIIGRLRMAWNKILTNIPSEVSDKDKAINEWFSIYKMKSPWLDYSYRTVDGVLRKRRRLSLNAGKMIVQELNNLVFSEPPTITTDKAVQDILDENNFMANLTDLSEYTLALGGGALKLRNDGSIKIDFVKANNVVPITWDNVRITEAAFIDNRVKGADKYTRVETHRATVGDAGYKGYNITQELYKNDHSVPLSDMFPDLQPLTFIATDVPLFAYIKPAISNNFDPESPLGISFFGNSVDTLEALDIAFDSLKMELVLGKKRIIVPEQMVRYVNDPDTGKRVRYFDPADEVYVALNIDPDDATKIQDNSVELRVTEIKEAIQTLLDILSLQCGFSQGYLAFDGATVKTATEVISDNSRTFKTKVNYEHELETGILQIMEAIRSYGSNIGLAVSQTEYSVSFQDSVIEDRNTKTTYWMGLYASGLCTITRALQEIYKVTEEEAVKMASDIKAEKPEIVSFGA